MNLPTADTFFVLISAISRFITPPAILVLTINYVLGLWQKNPLPSFIPKTRQKLSSGFGIACSWGLMLVLIVSEELSRSSAIKVRVLGGTTLVLVFGVLLFLLKLNIPLLYGILEFCFATASCASSLATKIGDKLTPDSGVVLVGSLYFMIRSMENMSKGIDKWRKDRQEKIEQRLEEPAAKAGGLGKRTRLGWDLAELGVYLMVVFISLALLIWTAVFFHLKWSSGK